MKIVAATSNEHKVKELRDILSVFGIEILGLYDIGINIDNVKENGTTYEANALIKAKALSEKTSYPIISDDSGLEIESLNGEPGIFTARFAKEKGGHLNAMNHILNIIDEKNRSARFVCSIVFIDVNKKTHIFTGICDGQIAHEIHGNGGFGFDPFFVPNRYDKTFAEIGDDIKNKISHRGRALAKLVDFLKSEKLI